jgi:N-acetylglucosamine-6-phosphate deacetylase
MKVNLVNGIILSPDEKIENAVLTIDNGVISEISPSRPQKNKDGLTIDAEGFFITPGLIDIHFHGAMGCDAMDADRESLQIMSDYCARHGVTSFYPTTWSAASTDILESIRCIQECKDTIKGAKILGVHIEGPYVDVKFRGAQLPSMIRNPDEEEYQTWFSTGIVKIITCAPELNGCNEFIKQAVDNGIRISIGHSQATYQQVIQAADLGASQATHIFNGMQGLHHRDPGTVGGILDDDRMVAQVICDGVHLHPTIVRLILRAKTISRVILITDSIRGAGLPDGDYENGGQKFFVRDGIARTPEGGLSGSTLSLDQAIRNFIQFTGVKLEDALATVTTAPAKEMGVSNRKGKIAAGYDGDLVLFNDKLEVEKTIVAGEIIYDRRKNG